MENKPLLLFAPIYDFVAEDFVNKMNEVPADEPLDIWINSPGGRVFAGWSIIGAMQKRTGKTTVTVMGHAASMAVFFMLFADEVEALEVSKIMIHRADAYVETPEDQVFLDGINKDLRKQMESRIDAKLFEEATGKTFDQIFDPTQRIDLWLDAKTAKKIGLVNKIKKLDPAEIKAFNEKFVAFADFSDSQRSDDELRRSSNNQKAEINNNPKKTKIMTINELQASNPELVTAIESKAVIAERDRVSSYMAFIDVDKEHVVKAIKEGEAFTNAAMAEFTVKLTSQLQKAKLEVDGNANPKPATESKPNVTPAAEAVSAFENEVVNILKNK